LPLADRGRHRDAAVDGMGWLAIDPEAIGNPIALPAIGLSLSCPRSRRRFQHWSGVLLERIPVLLTVAGDLGKRRSAQR
jgi:hypothetical protein